MAMGQHRLMPSRRARCLCKSPDDDYSCMTLPSNNCNCSARDKGRLEPALWPRSPAEAAEVRLSADGKDEAREALSGLGWFSGVFAASCSLVATSLRRAATGSSEMLTVTPRPLGRPASSV